MASKKKRSKTKAPEYLVYVVEWEECDDFGPRHDGYSIHLTKDDAEKFMTSESNAYPPDSEMSLMPLSVKEMDNQRLYHMAQEAKRKGQVATVYSLNGPQHLS